MATRPAIARRVVVAALLLGIAGCWGSGWSTSRTDVLESITSGSEHGEVTFSASSHNDGVVSAGAGAEGPVSISATGRQSTVMTADGTTTTFVLDARGLPEQVSVVGPNAPQQTTGYRYNGELLEALTLPRGNSVELEYDPTSPNLRSRGNLRVTRRLPAPGAAGAPQETTYSYDAWYNQPLGWTDAEQNEVTVTLGWEGRDASEVLYSTFRETFLRNSLGQIESHTDVDGIERTWTYDSRGDLLSSVENGISVTYEYGAGCGSAARGLPCSRIPAHSPPETLVYNERDELVRYQKGRLVERVSRNQNGYPLFIERQVGANALYQEARSYNQRGVLRTREIQHLETDGSAQTLAWEYVPDVMGRVEIERGPAGHQRTFTYDHQGRVHRSVLSGANSGEQFFYL